jgi:hypothetical protein
MQLRLARVTSVEGLAFWRGSSLRRLALSKYERDKARQTAIALTTGFAATGHGLRIFFSSTAGQLGSSSNSFLVSMFVTARNNTARVSRPDGPCPAPVPLRQVKTAGPRSHDQAALHHSPSAPRAGATGGTSRYVRQDVYDGWHRGSCGPGGAGSGLVANGIIAATDQEATRTAPIGPLSGRSGKPVSLRPVSKNWSN